MSLETSRVRGQWLLHRPSASASYRLFCFPYSGVGASMYARWPSNVGSAEVCLIQPPGRENRLGEPHFGTFEKYAEQVISQLLPYLDRPFAFFGHCSSALAAFAAAAQLERAGMPKPSRLFVSSQVAPHEPPYGRFLFMGEDELAMEVTTLAKSMGSQLTPELLELGLSVMKADIRAHKAYQLPAPVPLSGGVTAIGWESDDEVRPELMAGWQAYGDDVRFITMRGTHNTFLNAPLALMAELAREMKGVA